MPFEINGFFAESTISNELYEEKLKYFQKLLNFFVVEKTAQKRVFKRKSNNVIEPTLWISGDDRYALGRSKTACELF